MAASSGVCSDELVAALRLFVVPHTEDPEDGVIAVSAAAPALALPMAPAARPGDAERLVVMSLGTTCLAAWQLGELALRSFAGPFDWIFSSPAMVRHVLADGFKTLLDPALFDHVGIDPRDTTPAGGHKVYSSMLGRRVVFNHHDLRNTADHSYFCRAAARLQWALRCQNPKLFVITNLEHWEPLVDKDLDSLFDHLRSRCVGQFDLVVVKFWPASKSSCPAPARSCRLRREGDAVMSVYELRCRDIFDKSNLVFKSSQDQEVFAEILAKCVRYPLGPRSAGTSARKFCHLVPDPLKAWVPERSWGRGRYGDDAFLAREAHGATWPQQLSTQQDKELVQLVEHYFSDDNLACDRFMHDKIRTDHDGWFNLNLILKFKGVRAMSATGDDVLRAIDGSSLEVRRDGGAIRRCGNRALPALQRCSSKSAACS